jgi:hypothetical protein
MKKRLMPTLIAGVAVLAVLAALPVAQAGTSTDSISIAFARDEPNGAGCALAATDVAGVVQSGNWNNVTTNAGVATGLVEDNNGIATTSSALVSWYSTNTWSSTGRGEEGNLFTGADQTLMTGYLDQNTAYPSFTVIQISNLPASFSGTYDVYILALGGYPGKGGEYTVVGASPSIQWIVTGGTADPNKPQVPGSSGPPHPGLYAGPDYVQAIGDDSTFGANGVNQNDFGNYLVWSGVSGPSVTIIATNLPMPGEAKGSIQVGYNPNPRAVINAVQVVVH